MDTTQVMIIWILAGVILGAVLGSFACCQARRLRRKEKGRKKLGRWSECEHCGHKITWSENIPIISWLMLRGRCKKCRKKIGVSELASEVGLAIIFGVLAWILWQETGGLTRFSIGEGVLWLAMAVEMTIMWMIVIYDAKWGQMPTMLLVATVAIAAAIRIYALSTDQFSQAALLNLAGAGVILPGLYFVLYFFSKEKLVGSGDWLLALAIALLLGDWWLAFFELFIANALASVVAIGIIVRDKRKKKKTTFNKEMSMKIPFGPYMVVALVVILATANWISSLLVRF